MKDAYALAIGMAYIARGPLQIDEEGIYNSHMEESTTIELFKLCGCGGEHRVTPEKVGLASEIPRSQRPDTCSKCHYSIAWTTRRRKAS